MKLTFQQQYKSIHPFKEVELPDFCVLTGKNGSGKTHLLQAIREGAVKVDDIQLDKISYFNFTNFFTEAPEKGSLSNFNTENSDIWEKFLILRDVYFSEVKDTNGQVIANDMIDMRPLLVLNHLKKLTYPPGQVPTLDTLIHTHIIKQFMDLCKELTKEEVLELDEDTIGGYIEPIPLGELISNNLNQIFLDYNIKIIKCQASKKDGGLGKSSEQITEMQQKAPWNIMNQMFSSFNLPHEITPPKYKLMSLVGKGNIEFNGQISYGDAKFHFNDLSSGEKILFTLALAIFKSQKSYNLPDLLLLDEVDMNLHPSMIEKLLNVIQDVFLTKGCKVVLATHSPTTVALVNETAVFEVKAGAEQNKIQKVSNKLAVNILSEGVMTLEKGLTIFDEISKSKLTIISEGYNFEHIKKAISLLGKELLNDIYFIEELSESTGETQLKMLFDLFSRIPREKPVLFIFDCDVKIDGLEQDDKTYCFAFEKNKENTLAKKGIENLYREKLFENYKNINRHPKRGEKISFSNDCKNDLLNDILQLNDSNEFKNYQPLVSKIKEILASAQ